MSFNVHPHPLFVSNFNGQTGKTEYQQTSWTSGMSVKQLWLGQILAAMATNPATMLDPENHIDYAVKLVDLAFNKMPT